MKDTDQDTREDAVYVLITRQNGGNLEVLAVLNRNGTWSLPDGSREAGESLAEAPVREGMEECGAIVTVGKVIHISEKVGEQHTMMWMTIQATIIEGEPRHVGDASVIEVAWKSEDETARLMPWHRTGIGHLVETGAEYLVEN